ncbi:MAG: PASTA domain-containing protein, partial [Eubacteriales bacterium]|nr:PASTA domain-containing protein [Eubacteriales bacterium]
LEQIIYKCTQKSVDRRYQKMEEVIADLKHSLIDPQGDFVKVNQVDNVAKTRVISDKELGEIKQTSKSHREENFDTGVSRMDPEEDYEDEEEFEEKPVKKKKKKSEPKAPREKEPKKPKGQNMVLSILILVLGIAILAAAIVFILKATGILDGTFQTPQQNQVTTEAPAQDSAVEVPDLVGKTEAEAKEIANSLQLGIQMMGEEVSTQAKGNISSQSPAAGSKVEANTTLQYYISKGVSDITLTGIVEQNAIEAQASLESQGLTVAVNKEYSELDDNGDALVEPGFVISVSPEEGSAVTPGSTVTLTVSRGKDWGSSASVPNVVGMQTNEALTILGKWLTINVEKQQNAEVPAGQVFAQSLEAESAADPDQPITITVSTGDQTPEAAAAEEETQAAEETAQTTTTSSEAVAQATAAGETWLCNQRLNTPDGYQGGAIRLQLIQQTGDSQEVSMIVDGEVVEFPYQLNITGVPGVADGTLYLSELVNGAYQDLGNYSISFEKVE